MSWLKPSPADTDIQAHNGSDDDSQELPPFLGWNYGDAVSYTTVFSAVGYDSLNGPHFRIGRPFYRGTPPPSQDIGSMFPTPAGGSNLDHPPLTRPARIAHTSVSPRAIQLGVIAATEWSGQTNWRQPTFPQARR